MIIVIEDVKNGVYAAYYENGQLMSKPTFKDDEEISSIWYLTT